MIDEIGTDGYILKWRPEDAICFEAHSLSKERTLGQPPHKNLHYNHSPNISRGQIFSRLWRVKPGKNTGIGRK
jgi:hypothetical protein